MLDGTILVKASKLLYQATAASQLGTDRPILLKFEFALDAEDIVECCLTTLNALPCIS